MIGASFGLTPEDEGYMELRDGFFSNYEAAMAVHSGLFDGIAALLAGIEAAGLQWGIVTNKSKRFTDPLLPQIGLAPRRLRHLGRHHAASQAASGAAAGSGQTPESGARAMLVCGRRPARHPGRQGGRHADHRLWLGLLRPDRTATLAGRLSVPAPRRTVGIDAEHTVRRRAGGLKLNDNANRCIDDSLVCLPIF
jgi:hypothetical protein